MVLPEHKIALERLAELSRMLGAATDEIAELDETAVKAKIVFETQYARQFLLAEGPIEVKKQVAVLATREAREGMELAAVQVRACKERIRTLGTQIEVGRSLASAQKAAFGAEGAGQWT